MRELALAILLCGTALAQDHAPSPQQCVADANLWYHQITTKTDPGPSFNELGRRVNEMRDCDLSGAPKDPLSVDYLTIEAAYLNEQNSRQAAYIKRHHLSHEFLTEDAAGQR